MHLKRIFIALACLVVLTAPLGSVFAQQSGINVRPAIIEETADPGEVITGEIDVTNQSDDEVVLYLRARNISGLYPTGLPMLAAPGEKTVFEFAEWITPDLTGTVFGPRETRPIRYRIEVPEDASPGGHFGVLFASREPPDVDIQGVTLGFQVGTAFNLRVSGQAIEDAFIGSLATDKSVYKVSRPQVSMSVDVENRGNVLLRPQGVINILTLSGDRVATIPVNDSAGAAFPGQTRTFEAAWEPENFTFGRFQAVASVVYGADVRKTVTVSTSFWVLPFRLIFGILGLLIAIFVGAYIWVRLAVRKRVQEVLGNTKNLDRAKEGVVGALPPDATPPLPKGALITVSVLLLIFIFLLILIFFFA